MMMIGTEGEDVGVAVDVGEGIEMVEVIEAIEVIEEIKEESMEEEEIEVIEVEEEIEVVDIGNMIIEIIEKVDKSIKREAKEDTTGEVLHKIEDQKTKDKKTIAGPTRKLPLFFNILFSK